MKIIPLERQDFLYAKQWIIPYEATAVQLSAFLRRNSEKLYAIIQDGKLHISTKDDILALIYIDKTILHCIPHPEKLDKNALYEDFKIITKEVSIKCISGEQNGTDFLISLINQISKTNKSDPESAVSENNNLLEEHLPAQSNYYKLMSTEEPVNPPEELCNGDEIRHCTENDMEDLFSLQNKYMQEEVVPKDRKVSVAEVSIALRNILKNQLCVAVFSDGEPVAKANTNAIGINWIQLGGVYTHPLFRRNHYAWFLISALCRKASRSGKKISLFVKEKNIAAINLYKKIGFKEFGIYEIAYY